jgi:iron complex outermembrane receptor protein
MTSRHHLLASALAAAFAAGTAHAETAAIQDMADLSLEQLSDIVVTSVTRQPARLASAPASLYIISAEDIRRSGVRSLPEALRLAPNLQVARVDARNYAITARGFNSVFANKLLVLIDGRSVYTPLFSGVFWDAQDVLLSDVARIEVISGPGATIWGANAVNGVINVITKSAADTQGGLAGVAAGADEKRGALRYGGETGNGGHYRLYAKADREDDRANAVGANVPTGWHRQQAGFRADWKDGVTVSGDVMDGKLHQLGTRDIGIKGANLVGSWRQSLSEGSDLRLQAVLDHTGRDQPGAFVESLNTLDLEAQHDVSLGGGHRLSWGAGYRKTWDRLANSSNFGFLPAALDMHWGNVFAQDEMALAETLRLTAGLKVEHNNYTGSELLPNLRLAWTPDPTQLVWTSLSRTVRAPSRIDHDFYAPSSPIPIGGVTRYVIGGGPNFVSETANVLELGYRAQPLPSLSYSATVYTADYDDLRTLEAHAGQASLFENMGKGKTRGLEMWTRWQAMPAWRLDFGAVFQHVETSVKPGSTDNANGSGLATNDPSAHWTLRSSHDLSETMQLDLTLRRVGALPKPAVPAYQELDVQWRWRVHKNLDLALVGQNLLHKSHTEFGALPGRSVFERAVLLTANLTF